MSVLRVWPTRALRFWPARETKRPCPHCHRATVTSEMLWTPALAWSCARCVEDKRPGMEGR